MARHPVLWETLHSYEMNIERALKWLREQPESRERDDIESILKRAVEMDFSMRSALRELWKAGKYLEADAAQAMFVARAVEAGRMQHRLDVYRVVSREAEHYIVESINPPELDGPIRGSARNGPGSSPPVTVCGAKRISSST